MLILDSDFTKRNNQKIQFYVILSKIFFLKGQRWRYLCSFYLVFNAQE